MIHSSIENVQPEQVMNNEQKVMESTSAQVLPMQCYAQGGKRENEFQTFKI